MGRLLACATALLLTLSACQSDADEPAPSGLTFLVAETAERPAAYWQAAVDRVGAGMDIELTVLPVGADPTAHVRQMLSRGGALPDIMAGVSPQGLGTPELLYGWQAEETVRFRLPYSGSVKGQIYRLPATGEALPLVYYNKDLLAEAGVDEVPGTFADLLKTAEALKDAGIRPFAVGGVDAATLLWSTTIATDVYRVSPGWMQHRRLGHVHFCDEEFRASAEKIADLGDYISLNDAGGDATFLSGEGAMYPASSRFALTAAAQPPDFEIGAFTWPTDDGSSVVPAYLGGGGLSVSASSKDLAAAKRFALAFSLDGANLDHAAEVEGLFPAVTDYTPPEGGEVYRLGWDLYAAALDTGTLLPAVGREDGDDGVPSAAAEEWQAGAAQLLGGLAGAAEVCGRLDEGYQGAG